MPKAGMHPGLRREVKGVETVCPLTFMRLVRQAKHPGEGFPVLTISTVVVSPCLAQV
jgi:hypothetical protein